MNLALDPWTYAHHWGSLLDWVVATGIGISFSVK